MTPRSMKALPWAAVAVVTVTLLPILDIGFLADDWLIASRIHADQANATGVGDHARAILAPTWADDYQLFRPASLLLLHLEWGLFGPDPRPFHAIGLVLWLATALVVGSTVRHLLDTRAGAWPALAVLLFGTWPSGIEALSWGAAQADLLSLFWAICALRAMLANRLALTTGCVALATLSKETAVILPLLLLLIDRARPIPSRARIHLGTLGVAGGYLALRVLRFGDMGSLYRGRSYLDLLADRGLEGMVLEVGTSLHRLVVPLNDGAFIRAYDITPIPLHVALLATTAIIGGLLAWTGGRSNRRLALGALGWVVLPLSLAVVPLEGVGADLGRSRLLVLPAVGWVLIVILGLHRAWECGHRRLAAALSVALTLAGAGLWRIDLVPYAEATRRVERLTGSLTNAAAPGTHRIVVLGIRGDNTTMHHALVSFEGCHLLAAGLYNVTRPPFAPAPGHAIDRVDQVRDLAEIAEPPRTRPSILRLDPLASPPTFTVVASGGEVGPPLKLLPTHGHPWKPGKDAAFVVSGPAAIASEADAVRFVIAEPQHGDRAIGMVQPIGRGDRFEARAPLQTIRAVINGETGGPRVTVEALRNAPGGVIVWWAELLRGEEVLARSAYQVVPIKP